MIFDIVTIFPDFFAGPFDHGIVRRARAAGLADIRIHDLRNFTTDKHRTVDDRPFGGDEGMVLKPEPIFAAVESLFSEQPAEERRQTAVVLLSAQGRLLNQRVAQELAQRPRVVLLCGRYEGVDERVAEHLATMELSIGEYILSGGELAAAVVVDTVTRLLPGALGDARSAVEESFATHPDATVSAGGILDCPHYTRPADFRGRKVPEVLLSGNHAEVRRWRRRQALAKTRRNRPDLLERAALSDDDRALLKELGQP
ncbi:MAG: tRNA (guanosine(37)-N1)-methyltransferase TrmD [Acidobacteria bacterium]|nr:tRNA (guanosine(37)-N1)-methyltransferase TrmD [Acidobacteriota bacterium]MCH7986526.1 tRNA (guanosine(37)-N1)-methyltransferase TrmD [Acidobacteriota bacterium]